MLAFGWSAGDIAMSIRVIWRLIEAFDNAKGAKKGYEASRAFLRGLVPILQRIQQYLENPDGDQFQKDMIEQGRIIGDAYAAFETHLDKRLGLSSRRSDVRSIVHTIQWSLDDIQNKVEKLKSKIIDAIAFLGPLLAFEIRSKIGEITKSLEEDTGSREALREQVAEMLSEIRDHRQCLDQVSLDYQSKLAEGVGEIRDNTNEEMNALKAKIDSVDDSQAQLAESLRLLSQQIDQQITEQRQQAMSQSEASAWAKLQTDAEEQASSASDLRDTTSKTLNSTAQTLQGLSALNGSNRRLGTVSNKVSGASNVFDGFGKLGSLFGSGSGKKSGSFLGSRSSQDAGNSSPRPTPVTSRSLVRGPSPRERGQLVRPPMRNLPPPPRRTQPRGHSISLPVQQQGLTKPPVSVAAVIPPPLPLRQISDNPENRPKLPSRPRWRPDPPPKPKSLQLKQGTIRRNSTTSLGDPQPALQTKCHPSPAPQGFVSQKPPLPPRQSPEGLCRC